MIKQLFDSIFSKKNEARKPATPTFKITENGPMKSDFEVTELSYEEYTKIMSQDKRQATSYVSHDRRNRAGAVA